MWDLKKLKYFIAFNLLHFPLIWVMPPIKRYVNRVTMGNNDIKFYNLHLRLSFRRIAYLMLILTGNGLIIIYNNCDSCDHIGNLIKSFGVMGYIIEMLCIFIIILLIIIISVFLLTIIYYFYQYKNMK